MNKKRIILIGLAIYLSLVTGQVDWYYYSYIFFVIKTLFFYKILKKGLDIFDKIQFDKTKDKLELKDYVKLFICIMLIMSIALFMYYPDNFQWDVRDQYNQVLDNSYNDWHPVIHTLLFYRLPTLLIQHELMCCLFQMVFVSIILLYFFYSLNKFGFSKKVSLFIIGLFALNPSFDILAIFPFKDVAFSYSIFLVTIFFMNIYLTKGEWLKSKVNFFLFLLSSFGIAFFRHNGIFTFFVMMIMLIFLYKNIRKKSICILLVILSLRFVFIPFIYGLNNIKKTNITVSEMVCVLTNQIDYIYMNNGNITAEQLKMLKKVQDLDILAEYYNPYNLNAVKYKMRYNDKGYSTYINEHPKAYFKLWKDIVINNKALAIKSYMYTTYCIWHIGIDTSIDNTSLFFINTSKGFSKETAYLNMQKGYFTYRESISNGIFSMLLVTVPMGLFYIIFSLIYCMFYCQNKLKFKEKLEILLPYAPVLSNILLMFMLLPGRETRFLYSNILCAYPLMIFMILVKCNRSMGENKK